MRLGHFAFFTSVVACGGGGDGLGAGLRDATAPPDGAAGDASADAAIADAGGDTALADAGDAAPPRPLVAYASGYASTIAWLDVDGASGALTPRGNVNAFGASPSFLAVAPDVAHLYAVSEATAGRVGAYAIDRASGALTYLNDVSSGGDGPAHVAVEATGRFAFVANYGDGSVAVLPIAANGQLGAATDTRTVGANAHMIVADPSNKFVFVPCKGADYVAQFVFDAGAGKLTPNATPRLATAAGAGPRHIAFHPNGKLAYLISETKSTMTALSLDAATGQLTEIETKSTLPAGFMGSSTGAEVWVHPSGRFVYGSNRGDDSIVAFSIDGTGRMTLVGHTKTGGTTPRSFAIDPNGAFLYAANQGSGTVVTFRIEANGALTATGNTVMRTTPSFVGVARLP